MPAASFGPSSATGSSGTAAPAANNALGLKSRSTRHKLFQVLELYTHGSLDEVNDELLAHFRDLRLVLDCFGKPNNQSKQSIQSGSVKVWADQSDEKLSSDLINFVLDLSNQLDLDEVQTLQMLLSCLYNEVRSPFSRIRFGDGAELAYDEQLANLVTDFYFDERIATIHVLSAVVRAGEDEGHRYHEQTARVLPEILEDLEGSKLVDRILDQVRRAMSSQLLAHVETDPYSARRWAKQLLKEQIALLELLFVLYYSKLQCPPARILQILELFVERSFGLAQATDSVFDGEALKLRANVSQLCILIGIEVLSLEDMVVTENPMVDGGGDRLLASPVEVTKITSLLRSASDSYQGQPLEPLGPILLAWASFLQQYGQRANSNATVPPQLQSSFRELTNNFQNFAGKLAMRAYNLKVWDFLYISLKLPCYRNDQVVHAVMYRSVLKGLATVFQVSFPANVLPNVEETIRFLSSLFDGNKELSMLFWNSDFQYTYRRSYLDLAKQRFPFQSDLLINLVTSLIGDEDSALSALNFLMKMQSFTQCFDKSDYSRSPFTNEPIPSFEWNNVRGLVYGASEQLSLRAPRGSRAYPVGAENTIMQLDFAYSAWHLMLSLIDSFLRQPGIPSESQAEAGGVIIGTVENVSAIFELFQAFLKHASSELVLKLLHHLSTFQTISDQFTPTHFVGLICRVLTRCASFPYPPTELLTSCMKCLTLLLSNFSDIVWTHLRQESLLPRVPAFSIGSSYRESYLENQGYMQQMLLPYERSIGRYSTTLAFLDLVAALIKDAYAWNSSTGTSLGEMKASFLASCISYIHSEIFPSYGSWRYVQVLERFRIGLRILIVYNAIMRDRSFAVSEQVSDARLDKDASLRVTQSEGKALGAIQEYLVGSFLGETGSVQSVAPLLDIIGVDNDMLEALYRRQRLAEVRALEGSIIHASTLLKNLLAIRISSGRRVSFLEQALLDRTVRSNAVRGLGVDRSMGENPELMYVIAYHIVYPYNRELEILSAELLTFMCVLTADWEPRPPSLLGYFGDNAKSLVRSLLDLLVADYIPEKLQAAIWSFVGSVMRSQPGLAKLLLTGDGTESNVQKEVAPKGVLKNTGKRHITETTDERSVTTFDAALWVVGKWEDVLLAKPRVLTSTFQVLEVLWENSREYFKLITSLRKRADFWENLEHIFFDSDIISQKLESLGKLDDDNEAENEEMMIDMTYLDGSLSDIGLPLVDQAARAQTREDRDVKVISYMNIAKASVLRILAQELLQFGLLDDRRAIEASATETLKAAPVAQRPTLDAFNQPVARLIAKLGGSAGKAPSTGSSLGAAPVGDAPLMKIFKENSNLHFNLGLNRALQDLARKLEPFPIDLRSFKNVSAVDIYDSAREYGEHYVYDVDLIEMKLRNVSKSDERGGMDLEDAKVSLAEFTSFVRACNRNWSITDSEMVLLQSWRKFFVVSFPNGIELWRNDSLFKCILQLSEVITGEKRTSLLLSMYRNTLSEILLFLCDRWVKKNMKVPETTAGTKNAIEQAVTILAGVLDCLRNKGCDEGMEITSTTAHLAAVLRILQLLYRLLTSGETSGLGLQPLRTLESNILLIFAEACEGLGSHVSSLVQAAPPLADVLIGASETANGLYVCMMVLNELVRLSAAAQDRDGLLLGMAESSFRPSNWLPIMERANTIPNLLGLFQAGVSGSMETSRPVLAEQGVLHVLLTLASVPATAERMAVHNLLDVFCSHSFTEVLAAGSLQPYVTAGGLPIGKERSANGERVSWHQVWCLQLAVVSRCLKHDLLIQRPIGLSQKHGTFSGGRLNAHAFVASVEGFMKLYYPQFENAMNTCIHGTLTMGLLEELERVTELYSAFVGAYQTFDTQSANSRENWGDYPVLAAKIFEYFTYLFQHPIQLSNTFTTVTNEEKELYGQWEQRTHAEGYKGKQSPNDPVRARMLGIIRNITTFFVIQTKGEWLISHVDERADWPFATSLIVLPTPSTHPHHRSPPLYQGRPLPFSIDEEPSFNPAMLKLSSLVECIQFILDELQVVVQQAQDAPQSEAPGSSGSNWILNRLQERGGVDSAPAKKGSWRRWRAQELLSVTEMLLVLCVTQFAMVATCPFGDFKLTRQLMNEVNNDLGACISQLEHICGFKSVSLSGARTPGSDAGTPDKRFSISTPTPTSRIGKEEQLLGGRSTGKGVFPDGDLAYTEKLVALCWSLYSKAKKSL
ncbi:nucleoporin subcomplex protein binding to Pom34-domain-containing protein [Cladochytrium replicatum]|nr:nucleoporin subcomplex protein binding to Pom34-domain-containing protein [Cladochytrium replicatum]